MKGIDALNFSFPIIRKYYQKINGESTKSVPFEMQFVRF